MIIDNGLHVNAWDDDKRSLVPIREGKPLLEGAEIHQAQAARDTLAITLKRSGERLLMLLSRSENRILSELSLASSMERFALTADGLSVAHMRPFRTLAISPVNDVGSPRVQAQPAALHSSLDVTPEYQKNVLRIRIGVFVHTFVADHVLVHTCTQESEQEPNATRPATRKLPVELPVAYDSARFPPREMAPLNGWWAVADRLGQVLVYSTKGHLVVTFLIRRERAAAWIPEGVFWGDPLLIGGPATPDAAERIGKAIRIARLM